MKIEIPITECDIEMFRELLEDGESFTWTFDSDTGEKVDVEFISEGEE